MSHQLSVVSLMSRIAVIDEHMLALRGELCSSTTAIIKHVQAGNIICSDEVVDDMNVMLIDFQTASHRRVVYAAKLRRLILGHGD